MAADWARRGKRVSYNIYRLGRFAGIAQSLAILMIFRELRDITKSVE